MPQRFWCQKTLVCNGTHTDSCGHWLRRFIQRALTNVQHNTLIRNSALVKGRACQVAPAQTRHHCEFILCWESEIEGVTQVRICSENKLAATSHLQDARHVYLVLTRRRPSVCGRILDISPSECARFSSSLDWCSPRHSLPVWKPTRFH